jgi:hypothetical protein
LCSADACALTRRRRALTVGARFPVGGLTDFRTDMTRENPSIDRFVSFAVSSVPSWSKKAFFCGLVPRDPATDAIGAVCCAVGALNSRAAVFGSLGGTTPSGTKAGGGGTKVSSISSPVESRRGTSAACPRSGGGGGRDPPKSSPRTESGGGGSIVSKSDTRVGVGGGAASFLDSNGDRCLGTGGITALSISDADEVRRGIGFGRTATPGETLLVSEPWLPTDLIEAGSDRAEPDDELTESAPSSTSSTSSSSSPSSSIPTSSSGMCW